MADVGIDVASMRQEYSSRPLYEKDLGGDPIVAFEKWLKDAVNAKEPEPNAMTLATVDQDGGWRRTPVQAGARHWPGNMTSPLNCPVEINNRFSFRLLTALPSLPRRTRRAHGAAQGRRQGRLSLLQQLRLWQGARAGRQPARHACVLVEHVQPIGRLMLR